jgi:hypothetical protein
MRFRRVFRLMVTYLSLTTQHRLPRRCSDVHPCAFSASTRFSRRYARQKNWISYAESSGTHEKISKPAERKRERERECVCTAWCIPVFDSRVSSARALTLSNFDSKYNLRLCMLQETRSCKILQRPRGSFLLITLATLPKKQRDARLTSMLNHVTAPRVSRRLAQCASCGWLDGKFQNKNH